MAGNSKQETSPLEVLWQAVSSPGFGFSVLILWLAWFFMATQVPQGADPAATFEIFRYGVGEAIQNTSLNDALRSWVVGLLTMFTLLGVIARTVRNAGEGSTGVVEAEITLPPMTPSELGKWLREFLKISRWGEARGTIRGIRGRLLEGTVLVFLGLGMLLVGHAFGWNQVTGVIHLSPEAAESGITNWKVIETKTRGVGGWVSGELGVGLSCESKEIASPAQGLTCRLSEGQESVEGLMSQGSPLPSPWGTLRMRHFSRGGKDVGSFWVGSVSGGVPARKEAQQGLSYQLSLPEQQKGSGMRLRPHLSQGGPFATVENLEDSSLWILGNFPFDESGAPPAFVRIGGQPTWELEWVESRGFIWFYGSLMILLLGIILVTIVPHLKLEAVLREDGGYLVRISSLNRPLLPKRLEGRAKVAGGAP